MQTSIEWLLYNLVYHNLVDNSPESKFWELAKQAKEMETEQLNVARLDGINLANKGYGK